jgi:hypothetical protein
LHSLGAGPLAYFIADIERGKPVIATVEEYAELAPYVDFIAALGGALAPPLHLIGGGQ